ncbi:MAG: hypothetical protein K0S65_332 [Labilithrix sp.]|nr:hypothetical protein [Labilithrix sp.]
MKAVGWALLTIATLWSMPALADPAPEPVPVDTLYLRNGLRHRGQVTEVVPGDHVTIVDDHNGMKVFPWSEVDRIVVTTLPPSLDPPPPPSASTPPTPAPPTPEPEPMTGPLARIHIDTPKPVVLYRRPWGTNSWTLVCNSPCTADVPVGDGYRVQGNGVHPSSEFRLGAHEGDDVTLAVDPSSSTGTVFGGILLAAGGLTSYVGLVAATSDRSNDKESTQGLIALAVGASLGVGGLLLFIASRSTSVTPVRSATKERTAEVPPRRRDAAWLGFEPWRSAEKETTPKATFPVLFEGRF